jgi:hypothetical protein
MTSKDVKFTFDRLPDPEIGAATVALYSNITAIGAPVPHYRLYADKSQSRFSERPGDYHALIMDAAGTICYNGTAVPLSRGYSLRTASPSSANPNYWLKDDEINCLRG